MWLRPPIRIWRLVLFELWRLVLLTAGVLVTVLSFAGAVRLLAESKLGPIDSLWFMAYAIPPMLEYALPFAAGFGATLAYHRLAADNEVLACHASGISHRALLVPSVVSGLVFAGVLIVLSNVLIPKFLRSMEELVEQDATRLIVNSINRGEPVRLGDMLVYADLVRPLGPDEPAADGAPGGALGVAYQRLWLKGVLAVQVKDGRVIAEGTAADANVWLFRRGRAGGPAGSAGDAERETSTFIVMRPRQFVGRRIGEAATEQASITLSREVADAFRDNPKYLTWSELERLRAQPERMEWIQDRCRVLATHLAERQITDRVAAALQSEGRVRMVDGLGRSVVVRASGVTWDPVGGWWVISPLAPGRPIDVERVLADGRLQRQQAARGWLRTTVAPDAPDNLVTLTLRLEAAPPPPGGRSAEGARDDPSAMPPSKQPGAPVVGGQLKEQEYAELSLADDPVRALVAGGTVALLGAADARMGAAPWDQYVATPRAELRDTIADLTREVTSKEQERLAHGAACLVMVLCGSVMALRLRESLPLTVYLWSFFPALATVLTISGGQQVAHQRGLAGLFVLWGGVAVMAGYTFLEYRRLGRH